MKALLTLLAAGAFIATAQQGITVQGTVINSLTLEPVPKASVILRFRGPNTGPTYAAESAAGGKFTFSHIAPGDYIITADRQGFIVAGMTEGEPITPKMLKLEAGKDLTVAVKLDPLCVIAGRVVDSDGDPVRGVSVQALRSVYMGGKRQLQGGLQANTDDHGEYRLFGLTPGKVYVQALDFQRGNPMPGRALSDVPTFYPSAAGQEGATEIKLAPGGEARGIDIVMRRETVYSIRGAMPANTAKRSSLQLMSRSSTFLPLNYNLSMNGSPDGTQTFEFRNVQPGSYILMATRNEDGHMLYSRQTVDVGAGDVNGLTLTFSPGLQVSGRLRFEGEGAPAFEKTQVRLAGPQGGAPAKIAADGTFAFQDLAPGEYDLVLTGAQQTYIKTLLVGERVIPSRHLDFTEGAGQLTVVLAADFADATGIVKNEAGETAPKVRVTAIPEGANAGRTEVSRFAFTDEKGAFHITGLAPGVYRLFAWDKVQAGAPQDPEFRKPYEKLGVDLKLESNGHANLDLRLIHVLNP